MLTVRGLLRYKLFTTPKDIRIYNKNLPKNLYLLQYYFINNKNRYTKIMFNINSVCCFFNSLKITYYRINQFYKAYFIFNIIADIYFGLKVLIYNSKGVLFKKYILLYKIPYYYFSTIIGIKILFIFIFFLALYLKSDYKYFIYFSKEN